VAENPDEGRKDISKDILGGRKKTATQPGPEQNGKSGAGREKHHRDSSVTAPKGKVRTKTKSKKRGTRDHIGTNHHIFIYRKRNKKLPRGIQKRREGNTPLDR